MGSSRLVQTQIYVEKYFRIFAKEKGWKIFISAAIITLIICSVTSADMFAVFNDTRNGAFALLCACIWIGLFNSIQSVCKERDIVKREHRSGLHISAYVFSRLIFEFFLCLLEALIVTAVVAVFNLSNFPGMGVFLPAFLELYLTFLLIIYTSDVLGVMISSIVKTTNTAMTVMPFVLIVQLVMSGMIFELEGMSEWISNFTISKWALRAISITSNVNEMSGAAEAFFLNPDLEAEYEFVLSNLLSMWGILLVFIVLYAAISIISLEFIDLDKR